jgi:hypothetical protein
MRRTAALGLMLMIALALAPAPAPAAGGKSHKPKKHHKAKKHHKYHPAPAHFLVTGGTFTLTFSSATLATFQQDSFQFLVGPPAQYMPQGGTFPLAGSQSGSTPSSTPVDLATGFGVFHVDGTAEVHHNVGAALGSQLSHLEAHIGSSSFVQATVLNPNGNRTGATVTEPFFTLATQGVRPVRGAHTLTLSNLQASLTAPAAALFDYYVPGAFTAGQNVGSVSIAATGK